MIKSNCRLIMSVAVVAILFFWGCGSDIDIPDRTTPLKELTVDASTTHQTIAGFGGCNTVFRGATYFPTTSDMQKAFGEGADELGLTIFRVSIPPNQSEWEAIARVALDAQNLGAKIMASPWNAPQDLLDPDESESVILPEKYGEYVDHLNAFDDFMKSRGVNLYAISVQNEPDIGEWTQWTSNEVKDFMKNYAGDINNRVITPESFNFNRAYYTGLLNDPEIVENIDIVGGHIYGNGLGTIPQAESVGKEIWMTEYLLNDYDNGTRDKPWVEYTESEKWEQTLEMLETIHEAMESNWNAYVWWYLKRYYSFIGEGWEGETEGEILKRGYAFSHYSKFVRPGYQRIKASITDYPDLKVTAYKGDGKVVVQVLNSSNEITPKFKIALSGDDVLSATGYITDIENNRSSFQPEVLTGDLVIQAQPKSITTLVINI